MNFSPKMFPTPRTTSHLYLTESRSSSSSMCFDFPSRKVPTCTILTPLLLLLPQILPTTYAWCSSRLPAYLPSYLLVTLSTFDLPFMCRDSLSLEGRCSLMLTAGLVIQHLPVDVMQKYHYQLTKVRPFVECANRDILFRAFTSSTLCVLFLADSVL